MSEGRKLKISFDEPEHGWIALTMGVGEERFVFIASHVPYDSINELAVALNQLLSGYSQATVRWNEEPIEYELAFNIAGNQIEVDVYEIRNVIGGVSRSSVFRFSGERDVVIITFWRALRGLQGRYEPSEYQRRWQEPFPTREIEVLTERITALKRGQDFH